MAAWSSLARTRSAVAAVTAAATVAAALTAMAAGATVAVNVARDSRAPDVPGMAAARTGPLGAVARGEASLPSPADADREIVWASAYNAVPAETGDTAITAPLFRKRHTPLHLTTGLAAQNLGPHDGTAMLTAIASDGAATSGLPGMTRTGVEPGASAWFWPPDFLAGGAWDTANLAYGSAEVLSTQPMAVVVQDVSLTGAMDLCQYRGAPTAGAIRHALPRLEAGGGSQPGEPGRSGIIVTNVDAARSATVRLELTPFGGGGTESFVAPEVEPGGATVFYLPSLPLDEGRYAGVVTSDAPVEVRSRIEWAADGRAAMHDDAWTGADVVVPIVFRSPGVACTEIAVQNPDADTDTPAELVLVHVDSGEVAQRASILVPARTSLLVSTCGDAVFEGLPDDFVGSARITSGGADLAVTAIVHMGAGHAVHGFEGVPVDRAAPALFAPLVHARVSYGAGLPELISRIAIHNPGAAAARVNVRYAGFAGPCAEMVYSWGPYEVAPGSTRWVDLDGRQDGVLPDGCTAAAAIQSADGGILASVLDEGYQSEPPTATATALAPSTGTAAATPQASATATPEASATAMPTTTATATHGPISASALYLPIASRPADEVPELRLEELYRGGGSARAVALDGARAYLVVGRRLVVLDVAAPSEPREIGSVELPDQVVVHEYRVPLSLRVSGSDVWVLVGWLADPPTALSIPATTDLVRLDVASPERPRVVAHAALAGHAMAVEPVGRHVAVSLARWTGEASRWAGLVLLDALPEAALAQVGQLETGTYLTRMHVEGHRLLASGVPAQDLEAEAFGAWLYDVADPSRPAEVARFGPVPDFNPWPLWVGDLPSGDVLILAHGSVGLRGWSLSCCQDDALVPAAAFELDPSLLHGVDDQGAITFGQTGIDAALEGTDLFLVDDKRSDAALASYDLSDPAAPRARPLVRLRSGSFPNAVFRASRLAASGGLLALGGADAGGLALVSVADRERPAQAGTWWSPGSAAQLAVAGRWLFSLTRDGRLARWDTSVPERPRWSAETEVIPPWIAGDVEVDESHLVISSVASRLQVVRVADGAPLQPFEPITDAGGRLALNADGLLVADPDTGLQRFRFTSEIPSGLDLVAGLEEQMGARDVAVTGDLAVVAIGTGGLATVRAGEGTLTALGGVSLPGFAARVASSPHGAHVLSLALDSTGVAVPGPTARLLAVDVAAPEAPRLVRSVGLPFSEALLWEQRGHRLLAIGAAAPGQRSGPLTVMDLDGTTARVVGVLPGTWVTADTSEDGAILFAADTAGELVIGRLP